MQPVCIGPQVSIEVPLTPTRYFPQVVLKSLKPCYIICKWSSQTCLFSTFGERTLSEFSCAVFWLRRLKQDFSWTGKQNVV